VSVNSLMHVKFVCVPAVRRLLVVGDRNCATVDHDLREPCGPIFWTYFFQLSLVAILL